MRLAHISVLLLLLTLVGLSTVLAQNTTTLSSSEAWHKHAVDNADMNGRISDAAEQYKQYAPIPRIAFYDVGYPKNSEEFNTLNGYAILLISALSQNPDELPLKRAYVSASGKQV